ncbi:MAG: hypothetical protein IJA56_07135 [Clostridia bacterium]|nr:hypothetical protein [Clostridia bacterium]
MPHTAQRKITILLTQYPTAMASALCWLTDFPYTHTSIGLSEDRNTYYSFVKKGFIVEKVTRYNKPGRAPFPCALYEIPVPEFMYQRIKTLLEEYVQRKEDLRYTHRSMLLSLLLYIPYQMEDRYFCSHFVAEVLKRAQLIGEDKDSVLYLPKDFVKLPGARMVFQGNLHGLSEAYGLA